MEGWKEIVQGQYDRLLNVVSRIGIRNFMILEEPLCCCILYSAFKEVLFRASGTESCAKHSFGPGAQDKGLSCA
jgi:hypothetical protein